MPSENNKKKPTVYHVTPDAVATRWVVYQENGSFKREYDRKEDAVYIAKLKAKLDTLSQVKVHTHDGRIEYQSNYGEETGDTSWGM